MADQRNFNTDAVPRTTDVFPQAVLAAGFIFVSGTTGVLPETKTLDSSFELQAIQAFRNIETILKAAGSDLSKVVKTTVFMVAGNDFATLNKVYASIFPKDAPARSTPQVNPFPNGILISVECIALQ